MATNRTKTDLEAEIEELREENEDLQQRLDRITDIAADEDDDGTGDDDDDQDEDYSKRPTLLVVDFDRGLVTTVKTEYSEREICSASAGGQSQPRK